MLERFPPGGFPSAWYVLGPSGRLRPGDVQSVHYFGRDLVLFRTESGEAHLVDSICPHLGANLGQARVEGENIVCAMHGFQFDGKGECVKLAYGTRPPPKARLEGMPLREVNDLILVWYASDGASPGWEIDALDWEGWSSIRHTRLELVGHPQEVTENSVDVGHFKLVHQYDRAWVVEDPTVEGPRLTATYGAQRSLAFLGMPKLKVVQHFAVTAQGLGYSLVEGGLPGTPIDVRLFVCSIPIDGERIHLHIGVAAQEAPVPAMHYAIREIIFRALLHDVGQDIPFWASKQYLDKPALADGDGPIPVYRRWCTQFYPSARRLETVA